MRPLIPPLRRVAEPPQQDWVAPEWQDAEQPEAEAVEAWDAPPALSAPPPLMAPPRRAGAAPLVAPRREVPVAAPRSQPVRLVLEQARRVVPQTAAAAKAAPNAETAPAPATAPAKPRRRSRPPTRLGYKLQRLWLTPAFRVAMRVGVPAFVLVMALGLWLGNDARRAAISAQIAEWRQSVEARPEFMVTMLSVEGASPALDAAVRQMVGIDLPVSSFQIDLDAARARVATLDAVKEARLAVRGGGVLAVEITERQPALVWRQDPGTLALVDGEGKRVALIMERDDRPDLPLIAGDGANAAAAEALAIVAAAGPFTPRLRGLVRMGARRWDMVLDRDQRILLPADNPVAALERLIALDQAEDLLARDLKSVDLRLKTRPTLRLAPPALAQMRRAQGIDTAENEL